MRSIDVGSPRSPSTVAGRRGAVRTSRSVAAVDRRAPRASRPELSAGAALALIENSGEGFVLVDARGSVTFASPSVTRLLGYRVADVLGRVGLEWFHPEDVPRVRGLIEAVTRDPGQTQVGEFRVRHRAGPWRVLECVAVNRLADAAVKAVVGNFRDVTDRRQLEEQLRHAHKMEALGRLAAGIAHDFNNVLTAVLGFSSLLLRQLDATDPARARVEQIRKAGDTAASLIQQLLNFSRKQTPRPRSLDLNAVVRDMQRMLQRLIGEDVQLVTVTAPGLGRVRADATQIQQVLLNLVVNARDAMPRGGRLTIETAPADVSRGSRGASLPPPGRYAALSVSDTGVGMDAATQARIFEPFFTTKEAGRGTGLGLATLRDIVRDCAGHVCVDSAPGRGTTFRVFLPRSAEAPAQASPAVWDRSLPPGSETVLVVEDEGSVRRLAKEVLEELGYTILEAESGPAAVDLLQSQPRVDLVLSDAVLPGMEGRELRRWIRRRRPEVKVLLMSGYLPASPAESPRPSRLLAKPFTPGALARRVRQVLDRR